MNAPQEIRQFRNFQWGEHIVVGGDCSQGGDDENWCQFISKTKIDVPMVYQKKGVAAEMTTDIYPILGNIYKQTGIPPTVAFERQNGGGSEMERLHVLNREMKYEIFLMPQIGHEESKSSGKLGWDTNTATRPIILGDLKNCINGKGLLIYDKLTIRQLFDFIVNKNGKPEASSGKHDDAVMSLAIAWQLFLRVDLKVPLSSHAESSDGGTVDKHSPIYTI